MYYSVCVPAVFSGIPVPDALERIRACGFSAYEFWGWENVDVDSLVRAQAQSGLRCAAMCTRAVPLVDPARRAEYLDGLLQSIAVAERIGCRTLITTVGQTREGVSRAEQRASIVEGLRAAAPIAESANIVLVVEPLNTLVNHAGYFLDRSDEAFSILREVQSPCVQLLFDVYHQQITEGNLIANLTANIGLIGHIHVAAVPGRAEITGENEIHYASVFAALRRAGYAGAIGLEYIPKTDPESSLRDLLCALPLEESKLR